jgi:cell shape-determining protein MreC
MARSTPTYTPIRNYAIGFFLSAFLLFSDISYGSFSQVRVIFKASTLYVQMISRGVLENIINTYSSFQETKNLLHENKELKEQIIQIEIKNFIEKTDAAEKIKIINLQSGLVGGFKTNKIHLYKIASIDLRNYLCCSTHKIFLQNPKKIPIKKNVPVLAGESYIGQTTISYLSFIEVILFSDADHVLPIKSNFFYCNARGKGKPLLIFCRLNENINAFKDEIGDPIYTSGLGGIFMKDIEIGSISGINSISIDEIEVIITLKANPLEESFYGIITKLNNEA